MTLQSSCFKTGSEPRGEHAAAKATLQKLRRLGKPRSLGKPWTLGKPPALGTSRAGRLPSRSLLAGLLVLASSCAIHPPHYRGEMRNFTASKPQRPEWTQWGVRFNEGRAFVTGVASQRESLEDARQAAEEDARRRLAASIQTTLQSEYEGQIDTRLQTRGDEVAEARLDQATRDRILAVASATLSETRPEDEYIEKYEYFGNGWETRCDCWLLLSFPEAEYRRQLDAVRGAPAR